MFQILKKDQNSEARLGILETRHGTIETPAYVIVGTHANVRALEADDIKQTGTQLIIVNTYHMWRLLGDAGLRDFEGLHAKMNWQRPLMTDSGGFQVFSFGSARTGGIGKIEGAKSRAGTASSANSAVTITENGVHFIENGQEFYFDAEKSIAIQQKLDADIILAFDEPSSPKDTHEYTAQSVERTHRWAERSLAAKTSNQLLYGITQGGAFEDLRKKSAQFIGSRAFDGFAIGGAFGSSFGSSRKDTFKELAWTTPFLPPEKPRHLLGIGRIEDVFAGVEAGIDTFDCVIPTREARHGAIWTKRGRIDIKNGSFRSDNNILENGCACFSCSEKRISRGELRELFKKKDMQAGRFATIHNIWFFNNLMKQIRDSLMDDSLPELKRSLLT